MSPCPHHAAVYALLRNALGRAHHGRRIARHTITDIARACPDCKEAP